MQRYHGSEKASNAATRVNVGSHKVKLSTTTAITPLPLVPSKNSVANVLSSGYIHVKKQKIWFIPFKQGSKSGNTPFRFYKTPVSNLKRQQGNHFIHHILKHFSFFYPPWYRGRLLQLPEADMNKGWWKQSDDIETPRIQITFGTFY